MYYITTNSILIFEKKIMTTASRILMTVISVIPFMKSYAQTVLPLYANIPNAIATDVKEKTDSTNPKKIKVSDVTVPTLTVYLPENAQPNRPAVIICPGGGYSFLVVNNEGSDVAQEFNKKGIAAFVLKYRLPNNRTMLNKEIGPLQDAQQAIKMVREHASQWNLDPSKIGIMGFSAGGHLASTASVKFSKPVIPNENNTSLRPDFSILIYPVISFTDSLAHKGSRDNLLGANAEPEKIREFSGELQVTAQTPPAFLVHCSNDKVVPVANSLRYYEALQKNGVNAELHIYPSGGHGYGLHNGTTNDNWFERCINWMTANKIL
jgi:acetyl esterase/lipase